MITQEPVCSTGSRITSIQAIEVRLPTRLASAEITAPMDRYPRFRHRRASWYGLMSPVLVTIASDDGHSGIGLTHGGAATVAVITDHLAALLIGQDPAEIDLRWNECVDATLPYGVGGLGRMAISATDLALWDLAGHRAGTTTAALLGAPPDAKVTAYASGNDLAEHQRLGFTASKLGLQFGPWDGAEGAAKNRDILRNARDIAGPDHLLMADAWMGWDIDYANSLSGTFSEVGLYWLEEPLRPDRISDHAALRAAIAPTSLATGEHLFTVEEFDALLRNEGADVLQPDVSWCGGITGAWKICDLALAAKIPVRPHLGGSPWSLPLTLAHPACDLAEWYVGHEPGFPIGSEPAVVQGMSLPERGVLRAGDSPGLGIEIDREAVRKYRRKPAREAIADG